MRDEQGNTILKLLFHTSLDRPQLRSSPPKRPKIFVGDKKVSIVNVLSSMVLMSSKRARPENECERGFEIVHDPVLRKPINDYENSIRDDVRRAYVVQAPCQPHSHAFPKIYTDKSRGFRAVWFKTWEWLEYSVSKDGAYCYWCYLFKGAFGNDVFTKTEFQNWKHAPERYRAHVGAAGSAHNNAKMLFFSFKDQRQSLARKVFVGNQNLETAYRTRLTAVVDVVRLLLQ
ncbi:hypothetical protein QQ045_010899 [Rhodiola kirilowii]